MKKKTLTAISFILAFSIIIWLVYTKLSFDSDISDVVNRQITKGSTFAILSKVNKKAVVLINEQESLSAVYYQQTILGWREKNRSNISIKIKDENLSNMLFLNIDDSVFIAGVIPKNTDVYMQNDPTNITPLNSLFKEIDSDKILWTYIYKGTEKNIPQPTFKKK